MYLEAYLFPFNLTIDAYLFILSSKFCRPWEQIVVLWAPSYLSAFFWRKKKKKGCSERSHTRAIFGEKKVSVLSWYEVLVYSVQSCTSSFIIFTNCSFSVTWLFPHPSGIFHYCCFLSFSLEFSANFSSNSILFPQTILISVSFYFSVQSSVGNPSNLYNLWFFTCPVCLLASPSTSFMK